MFLFRFKKDCLVRGKNLLIRLIYVNECSSFGMYHELHYPHSNMVWTKMMLAIRASNLLVASLSMFCFEGIELLIT